MYVGKKPGGLMFVCALLLFSFPGFIFSLLTALQTEQTQKHILHRSSSRGFHQDKNTHTHKEIFKLFKKYMS